MKFPWLPSRSEKGSKKRVLLIDDDREMRKTLSVWLGVNGFAALEGRNGREGWSMILDELPDLIILDIRMPHVDGFEICRLVRSTPKTLHIPILLLTGADTMGEVEEGFKAGANDYIAKPFDWERLHKKVLTLLKTPAAE